MGMQGELKGINVNGCLKGGKDSKGLKGLFPCCEIL